MISSNHQARKDNEGNLLEFLPNSLKLVLDSIPVPTADFEDILQRNIDWKLLQGWQMYDKQQLHWGKYYFLLKCIYQL